jgi:hypothetical protein
VADSGLKRGDRAYVVLDCVPLERDGIPYRRVIVRGVYAEEPAAPPPYPDAARNVIGVFIGLDMQTPAFLIEYPKEEAGA